MYDGRAEPTRTSCAVDYSRRFVSLIPLKPGDQVYRPSAAGLDLTPSLQRRRVRRERPRRRR